MTDMAERCSYWSDGLVG